MYVLALETKLCIVKIVATNVLTTEDGVHTKDVEGLIQMGECTMKIERPWEEFFCEKCVYCFQEDMCKAYMIGTSYVYCPPIRNCEKFIEEYDVKQEGENGN